MIERDTNNDLLVQSRFKNLILWEKMNGKTCVECAKECGVSYTTFVNLLNLSKSPLIISNGRYDSNLYTISAIKIADYYKMLPEDLFPETLYRLQLPNVYERQYASQDLLPLLAASRKPALIGNPEQIAESNQLRSAILNQLGTLTPREERILKLRFGLEDGEPMTLDNLAKIFNVSGQRIRQIETKALRKLRHPLRSKCLTGFLDKEDRPTTYH